MKRLLTSLAALAILAACQPAEAQTTPPTRATECSPTTAHNALCLVWTASTTTGALVSYRVERLQQVANGTWLTLATTPDTQYLVSNLAPATYTFRVVATVGTSETPSNTANGTVQPTPPTAPVLRVVQVVISEDRAPVVTVTASGPGSIAGLAAVGTPCADQVEFVWRGRTWRRPLEWSRYEGRYVSSTTRVAAPCA